LERHQATLHAVEHEGSQVRMRRKAHKDAIDQTRAISDGTNLKCDRVVIEALENLVS
jgi:hypothetical protein